MAAQFHLAQLNIARMKFGWDDPEMSDFMDALDPVNATADASPGFVWRFKDDPDGPRPEDMIWGDPSWLVNMSVWQSLEDLKSFVRSRLHAAVMSRRREWFSASIEAYVVLWWVPAGHRPDVAEAQQRLEKLRADGPTPEAFSFARPFPPPAANIAANAAPASTP